MAGENLPLVGKLLGHRRHWTTAVYAHLADDYLVEVAEAVGAFIARAMRNSANRPSRWRTTTTSATSRIGCSVSV